MLGTNAEVTRDYFQPPDPVVFIHCNECGGEIYEGDTYYIIDRLLRGGKVVCADCIDDAIINEFENMSFSDRLKTIGGGVRTAGGKNE